MVNKRPYRYFTFLYLLIILETKMEHIQTAVISG